MKMGKRSRSPVDGLAARPAKNQSKRNVLFIGVMVITAVLILWVYTMGRKAEETVRVIMWSQNIYKDQMITESMIVPYDMLKGEFDKYATTDTNGMKRRRIFLWEEAGEILNSYAAYPLQANTVAMKRDLITSRMDNSDGVMYSYPGKNLVPVDIGTSELQAFKTYLKPGDRINIIAIFSETDTIYEDDGYGGQNQEKVEVFKEEVVFRDIALADLLNGSGASILDIYAEYNERTTWDQAQLDASETFQKSVEPASMVVAFTPEEEQRYYYYLGKSNIEFKVSLPQRIE